MSKSTYIFGQAILGQLISLIDNSVNSSITRKYKSDRYIKRFTTNDHQISTLFCVFVKVNY